MTISNPGDLRRKLVFSRREKSSGTRGVKVTGFIEQFQAWGDIRLLRGGEEVIGSRLEGVQPAIATVRASPKSAQITSGWIFESQGQTWNVKEPPRLTEDRLFYEMLVSRGKGNA